MSDDPEFQPQPRYDVALSFAGEDRSYVNRFARILKARGIKVFYDLYEEANLWGKDLYVHLRDVYKSQALFNIVFVSRFYASKLWTNHERESAQARAFEENREYLLPVRFDDTELPGLLRTIGYIDLRKKSPQGLCKLVAQKLEQIKQVGRTVQRHFLAGESPPLQNEFYATFSTYLETGNSHKKGRILIDPSRYRVFSEILNDLFICYLSKRFKAFTYGSEWLITGEPFDTRVLVPLEWALNPPQSVHRLKESEWLFSSPSELGIVPGSYWEVNGLGDEMFGDSQCYALGCNNREISKLALTECKAVAMLLEEGCLKEVPLNDLSSSKFRYVHVFRDWLKLCKGGYGLVETGAKIGKVKSFFQEN